MPSLQIMPYTGGSTPQQSTTSGLQVMPYTAQASSNNSLVPASQGADSGVTGKMTAPFRESPYSPGKPFATPTGNVKSAPTDQVTTQAQTALQTLKLMKPVVAQINALAPKYLNYKGQKSITGIESTLGSIQQHVGSLGGLIPYLEKKAGTTPAQAIENVSNMKALNGAIAALPEMYQKLRNMPNTDMGLSTAASVVSPGKGEDGAAYAKRITQLYNNLSGSAGGNIYKSTLSSGLGTAPQSGAAIKTSTPQNTNMQKVKAGSLGTMSQKDMDTISNMKISAKQARAIEEGRPTQVGNYFYVVRNGVLMHQPAG